jgi:hypothetical protein
MSEPADWPKTLEIDPPLATCGHCRFATALSGQFSVEDGRLVWRGDADLQPRRGPGLESCCESSEIATFEFIEAGGERLSAWHVAQLRASARAASHQGS